MGAILGQPPEPTLKNQGRKIRADIEAIDELAEVFARSASSPQQAPGPSSVAVGCGRWP
jgi:hypothetical protein